MLPRLWALHVAKAHGAGPGRQDDEIDAKYLSGDREHARDFLVEF